MRAKEKDKLEEYHTVCVKQKDYDIQCQQQLSDLKYDSFSTTFCQGNFFNCLESPEK